MRDEKEERKKQASKVKQTNKAKQHMYMFLMRDERWKEERSKQDQTNNKAKQHSEPTTLYSLDRALYH